MKNPILISKFGNFYNPKKGQILEITNKLPFSILLTISKDYISKIIGIWSIINYPLLALKYGLKKTTFSHTAFYLENNLIAESTFPKSQITNIDKYINKNTTIYLFTNPKLQKNKQKIISWVNNHLNIPYSIKLFIDFLLYILPDNPSDTKDLICTKFVYLPIVQNNIPFLKDDPNKILPLEIFNYLINSKEWEKILAYGKEDQIVKPQTFKIPPH